MTETKQQIKDRLLRHAAVFWELGETPAEADFDPLVGLLFGACATELEKIANDIEESRSRVLERLVHLLFPEVLTTALPAHAVAHAEPLEAGLTLSDNTAFYARQAPARGRGEPEEIFFTPVLHAKLCRSRVEYIATPQTLYRTEPAGPKRFWTSLPALPQHLPANELWIGISGGDHLTAGCSFYFELRNESLKESFYEGLPNAAWTGSGNGIEVTTGYGAAADTSGVVNPDEVVEGRHNITRQLLRDVQRHYRHQFVTVASASVNAFSLPPFLQGNIKLPTDKRLPDGLTWLCVRFPATVSRQALDDVNVHLNCFPVVNRRQYRLQQKLQQFVNIVPLENQTFFLDVEDTTTDDGRPVPQAGDGLTANLRYGGVGRFSSKEALASLEALIQQIKDESSAYAVIGNDFLLTELTSLQQTINKLEEQLVNRQLTRGTAPHLVFSGKKDPSPVTVHISYWGTQGQDANNVRSNTPLYLLQNAELNANTFQLMTATAGGRAPLTESGRILAYKSALLSKEKLVTTEDIIAFCRLRTGFAEGRYTVEKGYDLSALATRSFTKTIDVKIELPSASVEALHDRGGIAAVQKELADAIAQRSNFFMPVRVFIQ